MNAKTGTDHQRHVNDWPRPVRGEIDSGVHLWVIALDDQDRHNSVADFLAPAEKRHARRLYARALGERYAVGRTALRVLLGAALDLSPEAVPIEVSNDGKPFLPCNSRVQFNLAHCEGIAVVGLTTDQPIGVDIERSSASSGAAAIAECFFDSYESHVIAKLGPDLVDAAFTRCWTTKEAVLKALGLGLMRPLREVVVEPDPRRPQQLLRVPGRVAPDSWTVFEVGLPGSRMIVSIAIAAPGARLAGIYRFQVANWLDQLTPPGETVPHGSPDVGRRRRSSSTRRLRSGPLSGQRSHPESAMRAHHGAKRQHG